MIPDKYWPASYCLGCVTAARKKGAAAEIYLLLYYYYILIEATLINKLFFREVIKFTEDYLEVLEKIDPGFTKVYLNKCF